VDRAGGIYLLIEIVCGGDDRVESNSLMVGQQPAMLTQKVKICWICLLQRSNFLMPKVAQFQGLHWCLVVSSGKVQAVSREMHDFQVAGHMGVELSASRKRTFNEPNLKPRKTDPGAFPGFNFSQPSPLTVIGDEEYFTIDRFIKNRW